MSVDSPEPFGEEAPRALAESAKFGSRLLDSADKLGGYLADVAGRGPHDFVGVVIGDWLAHVRVRRWTKLQADTKRILEERGVKEPYEEISPSIAVPLLEAAVDETREELAELWAKLLAAASDPSRKNRVRSSLIATLKQMDPLDAKVLDALNKAYPAGFGQGSNARDQLTKSLAAAQDDILVSFARLEQLQCVGFAEGDRRMLNPVIAPLGRLLMFALQ